MTMNPTDVPCAPAKIDKGPEDARYVEDIMEHAFLSEVLQHCWFILHHRVEVIRPDVDAGGYDLVLEADERIRHVQLKSRWQRATGPKVLNVNSRLLTHLDPCVVWIFWEADPATCRVTLQYRYSEKANRYPEVPEWPEPMPGALTFELRSRHFLPGYLKTPDLVPLLFEQATP